MQRARVPASEVGGDDEQAGAERDDGGTERGEREQRIDVADDARRAPGRPEHGEEVECRDGRGEHRGEERKPTAHARDGQHAHRTEIGQSHLTIA